MNIEQSLSEFIVDESLPESYINSAVQWFVPLLDRITLKVRKHQNNASAPLFIGINGAQGSGKSTLSSLLVKLCLDVYGLKAVCMSLDDFYLTKQERLILANTVHPLLETRGVPGTHDIALLNAILNKLTKREACDIPIFDKATDDRAAPQHWQNISSSIDIIILEGWCIGSPAQTTEQLCTPVNALESEQDADGVWRNYANDKLSQEYQHVYARFDYLIMLKAPSFQDVFAWRCEQEHKMQQKNAAMGKAQGGMSDQQISIFVQYYQRITEHGLLHLPERCDEVFLLDQQRSIVTCQTR